MFDYVFSLILTAFQAGLDWFVSLFSATGAIDVFLGVFFVAMAYRFLLAPLFKGGASGSDKVKKSKDSEE